MLYGFSWNCKILGLIQKSLNRPLVWQHWLTYCYIVEVLVKRVFITFNYQAAGQKKTYFKLDFWHNCSLWLWLLFCFLSRYINLKHNQIESSLMTLFSPLGSAVSYYILWLACPRYAANPKCTVCRSFLYISFKPINVHHQAKTLLWTINSAQSAKQSSGVFTYTNSVQR